MGVCKVVAEGGLLGGFLSIRFILIFLACLFTLLFRVSFVRVSFTISISDSSPFDHILAFSLLTLPGLITGIIFIWHRPLFNTFLKHPSLLLLPMFTFFTFKSNSEKCCTKKNLTDEVKIRFSVKATYLNILFTLMGVVVFASIPPQVGQVFVCGQCSTLECSFYLLYTQFLCFLPGFLFTLIFLFCCSCPNNCSCSSPSFCFFSSSINASCSCYPPLKFGVFRPSSPLHQEIEAVEEIALEDNQVDSNERGKAETMGVEEKEEEV